VDWHGWHEGYDQPGSRLATRLEAVQRRIREVLDAAPAGPIRAVSLCAGQGRDLIGALARHPRRDDVTARLVELDPRNVDEARHGARAAGLPGVEVVAGDAATLRSYVGAVPADRVLMCGVFGNISDDDVRATVAQADQLCATGASVVWTRHRDPPDLAPSICDWFAEHGFELVSLSDPESGYGVGVHRFTGTPPPLREDARLFTFLPRRSDPRLTEPPRPQ
jgi:hypothetical protein